MWFVEHSVEKIKCTLINIVEKLKIVEKSLKEIVNGGEIK